MRGPVGAAADGMIRLPAGGRDAPAPSSLSVTGAATRDSSVGQGAAEPEPAAAPSEPSPDQPAAEPEPAAAPSEPSPDQPAAEPEPAAAPSEPSPDQPAAEPEPAAAPSEPSPDRPAAEPEPAAAPSEPSPDRPAAEPEPAAAPSEPSPDRPAAEPEPAAAPSEPSPDRPAAEPEPDAAKPDTHLPPEGPPPPRRIPPPPVPASRPAGTGRGKIAAIAVAVAAAAFLAGLAAAGAGLAPLGGVPADSTTNDELAAMIEGLRGDLGAPDAAPASRPQQAGPTAEALSDDDPAKGDPDAPLTIVEFSDFQCPFCKRFYEQTLPLIERDYIDTGKARLVYRDMPLEQIHPQAPATHVAAECAGDQGMFWEYHDLLFDRQGEWSRLQPAGLDDALAGYAAELGLDASFGECVRSPEAAREMRHDLEQALGMGLTGTPTFLIGGNGHDFVAISGAQPYSTFSSILDGML